LGIFELLYALLRSVNAQTALDHCVDKPLFSRSLEWICGLFLVSVFLSDSPGLPYSRHSRLSRNQTSHVTPSVAMQMHIMAIIPVWNFGASVAG
jgi:hypothetical protein